MRSGIVAVILLTLILIASSCWDSTSKPGDRMANESRIDPADSKASNSRTNNANADQGNQMTTNLKKTGFMANIPANFSEPSDDVGRRLLKEYGAVFVAKGGVVAPNTVVFKDASEVSRFQSVLQKKVEKVGGFDMELQASAMDALLAAVSEAAREGVTISPRDTDSAKRGYDETVDLWKSRVDPALIHWTGKGRISKEDADRIRALSPYEQVSEVFRLEEQGMYFAKDLSKSIIYSVAPPGTSQHLSMLAFDVKEHENEKVRAILAKHGWYQTVVSDLPHFTFLGVSENRLEDLGLKITTGGGRTFWIPAI